MNVPIKVISSFCLLVVMSILVHSNAYGFFDKIKEECMAGDLLSCELLQSLEIPNYGGGYGSSSSGSSKMECISRCTRAWTSCNGVCRATICFDDECTGETSRCYSQCNTEKNYCEAMCN